MEHNIPSPSQDPVEQLLQEVGHEPAELRPETKILHKQQLLSLAERLQKEAAETVQAMEQAPETPRRTFRETLRLVFGGAGAGFAIAMCALVLFMNVRGDKTGLSGSIDSLGRILIPAAQANDAFQVYADPETPKIADQSALILRSKVALSADQVQRTLRVDTGRIEEVERVSEGTFRVRLAAVPSDHVIRVALPASIQSSSSTGETTPRDYSWAVQTTDKLELVSSLPANNANTVPLDASLELVMNAQGFSNVTSSIEITPTTEGQFQMNGRRIVFLPAKPWNNSTLYTVRLKQGLTAEGLALPEDVVLQFQTGDATADANNTWLRIYTEFQEAYVGDAVSVPFSRSGGAISASSTVSVTGYRLTEDEAAQFLAKRLPYSYSFGSTNNLAQYKDIAKTEAFKADLPIFRPSERDNELVTLPKFTEQGWFIVRLASGPGEAWMFVQVTNIASYVVADKDQLVVWAVNVETQQPLSSLPVRMDGGQAYLTDAAGVARAPTPATLNATSSSADPAVTILRLGDAGGPVRALSVVGPSFGYSSFDRFARAHERTWGYAYPDRPLYRTSDEMKVAGIVQDRDRTSRLGQVELRLTKPSYVEDLVNGRDRTYASVPLSLDTAGRYEASLSWKNVTPGYYQLDLLRDGELVTSRSVEIRAFAKPAYYLDVTLSAKRLFAGQEAQARIQASFFSGAPVPKARVGVRISQGETTVSDQEMMLDDQGCLDLTVKTLPVVCNERLADPCRNTEQLMVAIYPMEGEEAQIVGSAMAEVVGAEIDLRGDVKEVGDRAELTLQTYRRDLSKELDEVGAVWSGRKLRGQVIGVRYERIQDGVWYDAVEKKVVPYYRYERRQDPPVDFTLETDGNGRARYSFPFQDDREFYEISVQGEDGKEHYSRFTTSIARGWYLPAGAGDTAPHLILEGKGDNRDVHVGEVLKPTFQMGTSTFDVRQGPGVLFLTLSRGIKQVVRSTSASWETTFSESLIPNATLRGVVFSGRRFFTSDVVVFLDKEDRTLDVQVTSDKTSYRPGEKATVRIQVKAKEGQPGLSDTKVAYAVVDESLLAVSGFYEEDPLQWINTYVADGMLFQRASHVGDWLFSGGGAEMGGGGSGDRGQAARRLFKDVAGTGLITLDPQGMGTAEIVLPDNLTSWRVTAVALGTDLRAGAGKHSLKVAKEVFVDAVIPARVLATDQPVLKVRAFGSGLRAGEGVMFNLNAPSLGLVNYSATGTAGQPIYVAVPMLQTGSHVVTVGVSQGAFSDRMERTLEVETTRIVRQELVTLEPSAGMALSAVSTETTQLVVSARGRTSLYPSLRSLAETQSLRSDARVAAAVARELLQSAYGEAVKAEDSSLLDIQTPEEGGLRLLPYGSSEVPLSMQIALTKPDAVDAWQLRTYLAGKLVNGGNRLERLQAMAGLAALRAPVVLDLQQAATLTDRTPQETLAIVEGLAVVGDTERAGQLMRELIDSSVLRDGQRFVRIGTESSPETYEATAEAAALAERLLLPQAAQLNAFIEQNWSAEAFPVLAKVRYLAFRLQHIPAEDGLLQWTDGVRTETIQLKETPLKTIVLSPVQMANFRILNVSGPVALSYLRPVSGLPAKSPSLSLTRRYEASKALDQLMEGDELVITLVPRFATSSLDGCALIQDDLPANLQPLSQTTLEMPQPLFLQSNTISFVACKGDQARDFKYRVKVTARGTYRAEPALMQRFDTPSVATYSEEQTITVR